MTNGEFLDVLKGSGIPFVYHHWETPPKAPYGVFLQEDVKQFWADGVMYWGWTAYRVELYTVRKSTPMEKKLEAAMKGAGFTWEKAEEYITDEKLYQILYKIEVQK